MNNLEFHCNGFKSAEKPPLLFFSEDPLPLMQNCTFVELHAQQVILGKDEGTTIHRLPHGLDGLLLDHDARLLTLWLTPDAQAASAVVLIQIHLHPQHIHRIRPLLNLFIPAT